jgi:tripartite-type tricarboxylate transporter receptor subunit TctC
MSWLCAIALAITSPAWAYPTKPVRFIVPFTPGGGADLVGRVVGQKLAELWGQQVIVDNRAGAGGNIAAEITAAAAPDGYTLFQFNVANAIAPSVYKKLNYDPVKDFAAVTQLASSPFVLVAYPGIKAKNVQELIATAKAEPRKLSYASSGIGGSTHLLGELFKTMSRTDIVHVPYKGAVPALTDLTSGRVHVMFVVPAAALPHVKAGRLSALGVSSAKRSPLAPELPTIAESGIAGFEGAAWYGVVAPARTPRDIVSKLSRDVRHMLEQPDIRERFTAQGVEIVSSTPEEFARFIGSEIVKWRRVAGAAGISVE